MPVNTLPMHINNYPCAIRIKRTSAFLYCAVMKKALGKSCVLFFGTPIIEFGYIFLSM